MPCKLTDCSPKSSDFIESNPDVSGLGVLIGFLATAWATFLILLFHYFSASRESSNLLDISLRQLVRGTLHWNPTGNWDKPLRTVVLAMSDQQLVTGIAIMISGYYQLHCSLSLYHWQIITNLTWFSSITHLATLPFLQQYLRQHKYIFYLRVFFMSGLTMMLAVAIVPTASAWPFVPLSAPVKCLIDSANFDFNIHTGGAYTIITEFVLLSALLIRLVRMFSVSKHTSIRVLRFLRDTWRKSIVYFMERLPRFPRWVNLFTAPLLVFCLVFLILAHAVVDLVRSGIFEVLWLLFSLIWGSIRLFTVRGLLSEHAELAEEEDQWGFGQLVPVLLLLIPALLVAESCSEVANTTHSPTTHHGFTHGSPAQSSLLSHGAAQSQSQISLQIYPSLNSPTILGSSTCLPANANTLDTFYKRTIDLCTMDFRSKRWYLGTLHFMLSSLTATSNLVFPQAKNDNIIGMGEVLVAYYVMLLVGGLFPLMTIPLCGVIDSLEQRGTQRHWWSIVRVATSTERTYRRIRCGYYICFPIFTAISVVSSLMRPRYFYSGPADPRTQYTGISGSFEHQDSTH
ncbi:hypothetical protein BDW62DRAFT_200821 [Aspergillus aurantiobrunneus]